MKNVNGMYAAVVLAAVGVGGCQQALAECGIASTYSSGSRTANGERYVHTAVSAAHKSLPFGTRVVVRNQRSGRSITVRINDRGPFIAGRIIDLSTGAKNALGMGGLAPVCVEVVSYGSGSRGYQRATTRNPLVQAHRSQGRHYAKAGAATRHTTIANTGRTRTAQVRTSRKHYAASRHGRIRAVRANHHRRAHPGGANRRLQFALRDDG